MKLSEKLCVDCHFDVRTNYIGYGFMVKNKFWDKYGVKKKRLCLPCFEKRVGREL